MTLPTLRFTLSKTTTPAPTRPASRNRWAALCLLLAAVLYVMPLTATAQANEWTWIGGSSTDYAPGVYGTLGTPAPANTPGDREGATNWTDSKGNLWLFGGDGYDANGNGGELNDLWEYTPATNEWTWISGSNTVDAPSVYGTQGTPAPTNTPGSRYGATSWSDSKGNLWLFGGSNYDANGDSDYLNDLWEYTPATNEWTWISGSSTGRDSGVYGTKGTPAPANTPGGRVGATSWTDSKGNLWLFGGYGYDANGNWAVLNDLWEYTPATNEWTWISGSSTGRDSGVYGTKGTPAPANTPGSRYGATSWSDSKGNLWLFGGWGYDANGNGGYLDDLWEYTPATNEWTWIGGSSTLPSGKAGQPGVYGTKGTPTPANTPGSRYGATSWSDSKGNLWLFGGWGYDAGGNGGGLNDLWEYTPATNEWTWISGSNTVDAPGDYGTKGTPAPANTPGSRDGATSWTDSNGNLWLFGGVGYDANGNWGGLNDLWEYTLPAPAVLTTPAPSSTLAGSSVKFTWSTGINVTAYKLILGTTAGASDLYNSYTTTATTKTVANLPLTGVTIYATLYYEIGGKWYSNAYTYTAESASQAVLTTPTPGSTLAGSTVTFNWSKGTNVTAYKLTLGTTAGASNLYNSYTTTATTVTAKNLPTNGSTIYATLYSEIGGIWKSYVYNYTAK